MTEFFVSPERKRILCEKFAGTRDPDRAVYFVDACEREIVGWLKEWPRKSKVERHDAAQRIEDVSKKASELHSALKCLDDGSAWLLFSHMLSRSLHGVTQDEVWRAREEAENAALDLSFAADGCHRWTDAPITRRADQDLCNRFAGIHLTAFGALPSANTGGLFIAFCEDIANDLPEGVTVKIGRALVERSRELIANKPDPIY